MRLVIVSIALLVCCGTPAMAGNRYVSPDGNDANAGTEERPWQTVRKAAAAAEPGDTVLVKNGTYHERVVVARSGRADKRITIKAYPGHQPVLSGKRHAQWNGLVNLTGVSYITLENLTIRECGKGQGVYIIHGDKQPATHIELKKLRIEGIDDSPIQIRGNASRISVTDCVISDCGASGIDVSHFKGGRPHHVTLRGNTVARSKFAGIGSEVADHLLVENNTCHDCSLGIDIGSGDRNIIRGNTIFKCENGIALSSNEDSLVHGNTIHDVSEAFYAYYWSANGEAHARNTWSGNVVWNATWAIYEMNSKMTRNAKPGPTRGHRYINNVFHNIGGNPNYRSPFWFHGVSDVVFCNNTIVMKPTKRVIQLTAGSTGAVFRNNIIVTAGNATLFDYTAEARPPIDHNAYWNTAGQVSAIGPNDIVAEPRFADPAKGDFHLTPDSPCINVGQALTGFTDDADGQPRPQGPRWDIGAYEYRPTQRETERPGRRRTTN